MLAAAKVRSTDATGSPSIARSFLAGGEACFSTTRGCCTAMHGGQLAGRDWLRHSSITTTERHYGRYVPSAVSHRPATPSKPRSMRPAPHTTTGATCAPCIPRLSEVGPVALRRDWHAFACHRMLRDRDCLEDSQTPAAPLCGGICRSAANPTNNSRRRRLAQFGDVRTGQTAVHIIDFGAVGVPTPSSTVPVRP